MGSAFGVLVISVLAAADAQAAPPPQQAHEQASLSFESKGLVLAGIAYGIDAIDAQPVTFGRRLSANISAGQRSVSYSCPNEPQVAGGSRLTFNFEAGHRYELVCRPGKDAEIRPSDEC